jgi:hypothetical protein
MPEFSQVCQRLFIIFQPQVATIVVALQIQRVVVIVIGVFHLGPGDVLLRVIQIVLEQ